LPPPAVSPSGELTLTPPPGRYGAFVLRVRAVGPAAAAAAAHDEAAAAAAACFATDGNESQTCPTAAEPAAAAAADGGWAAGWEGEASVWVVPLPRVTAVAPALGPAAGGAVVTVYGRYFGPAAGRRCGQDPLQPQTLTDFGPLTGQILTDFDPPRQAIQPLGAEANLLGVVHSP
jgi:hypothetical protein